MNPNGAPTAAPIVVPKSLDPLGVGMLDSAAAADADADVDAVPVAVDDTTMVVVADAGVEAEPCDEVLLLAASSCPARRN